MMDVFKMNFVGEGEGFHSLNNNNSNFIITDQISWTFPLQVLCDKNKII